MNLAWRNLADHPARLAAAVAGITFVVAMMYIQIGFLHGFNDGNARMLTAIDADLFVVSAHKATTLALEPLPYRRVEQAKAVDGVQWAQPVYVRMQESAWRDPRTGLLHTVRVIAADAGSDVLSSTGLDAEALRKPDTVVFDRMSRSFLSQPNNGEYVEVAGRRVQVVGFFDLGTDIDADGNVIMSSDTFERCYPAPKDHPDARPDPEYIAVRLRPGASARDVQARLSVVMPQDVAVRTRGELLEIERKMYAQISPLSPLLIIGVVIGFIVGVVICSQILFNEVNDRLSEFATLKAIGHSDREIQDIVIRQAAILAVLGYVPGTLISWLGYRLLGAWSTLPMQMYASTIVVIGVLAFTMCLVSGLLAVRRASKADPAELF